MASNAALRAAAFAGWAVVNMPATVVAAFVTTVEVMRTVELWGQTTVALIERGPASLFWVAMFATLWARAGAEIDRALRSWKANRMRSQ